MSDTSKLPITRVDNLDNTINNLNFTIENLNTTLTNNLNNSINIVNQSISSLDSNISAQLSAINQQITNINTTISQIESRLSTLESQRHIIDTYSSGMDWWVKYSDGWVEQGRYDNNAATSTQHTFLIPFRDTNYSIYGLSYSGTWQGILSVISKQPTYFTMWSSDDSSFNAVNLNWMAKGYMT